MRFAIAGVLAVLAGAALAQDVPTEVSTIARQQVTVHLHPFLTEAERTTLRVVATNDQALALFVTKRGRHSAVAVAPGEGLFRESMPVASAFAISDLRDAETARSAALEGCEAARKKGPACVIVLEVAPAR
jgi:hypothetical protein